MRRARLTLALAALGLAATPTASAASNPAFVVWAGPTVPGTALHGVQLNANGKGVRLLVRPGQRASGKIVKVGSFSPKPAQLAAIRAAAKAAFAHAGVRTADTPSLGSHGGYASAVIRIGAKTHTLLGVNASSAKLRALLVELNQALPEADRLRDPETGFAQTSDGPSTSACPPGQTPTTISRRVSLAEAAQLGAATLTSKGGFDGDVVAVDASWKPTDKPVTVRINVEFGSYPGGPTASQVEASIESGLPPRTAVDGTEVKFDVVARERAPGAPPSPCFHEIQLLHDKEFRGTAGEESQNPLTTPVAGEWPTGRGAVGDRQIWTHETLHLTGLGDRYHNYFKVGKKLYQIPDEVETLDKQQLKEWADSQNLDVNAGRVKTLPEPGFEKDIMGGLAPKARLSQVDVDTFALVGAEELTVEAGPGDILLNKDASEQNLAVGAPFELTVSPGKNAHADGLVAYCIDLERHSPSAGQGYDVLGPAGAQPQPEMQYIQRILDIAATRQPEALKETEGAQDAVWKVSNDISFFEDPEADAILAAAGVPDGEFEAPHFLDPNAGSPGTAAVTPVGIVPAPAPTAFVRVLRVRPAKLPAGRRRRAKVRVLVAGAPARVRLELQRRGRRGRWQRIKRYPPRTLQPGAATLRLRLPPLRRGAARLVALGPASGSSARLLVRGHKYRPRKRHR